MKKFLQMKYILFSILALFVLNSCVTTNYLTIDTRHPALITLPPDAADVLIVDNVPISGELLSDHERVNAITVDSAKEIVINTLSQFMNEEKYFNKVEIYPYNTGIDGYYDNDMPLDEEFVRDICTKTSHDILISVDMFAASATIDTYSFSGLPPYNLLEIKLGSILRVYSKEGVRLSPPIVYLDSIYWNNSEEWNGIPPLNEAMIEASTKAADLLVNSFIPSWQTEYRFYYSDNSSQMKLASQFAKEGKWQEASMVWNELYNTEKKNKKKIRLAFNIALAKENLDDIENAVNWINIAFEMLPEKSESELSFQIVKYKTILENRKNNLLKLQEQL